MASLPTMDELRKMQVSDLQGELMEKRAAVAKMRLGIEMRSEKDTARYRREKRQVARLLTVLCEKEKNAPGSQKSESSALKPAKKSPRVAASRSASAQVA